MWLSIARTKRLVKSAARGETGRDRPVAVALPPVRACASCRRRREFGADDAGTQREALSLKANGEQRERSSPLRRARSVRLLDVVDYVDHAVRLHDVRDCDAACVTLSVPHREMLFVDGLDPQRLPVGGLELGR